MNRNLVKAAVAAALCTAAGSAFAFNPSITPPDYQIVFSGATASSNSTRTWIIDRVCNTALPIDVYRRWNGSTFTNDWAVACVTRTGIDTNGDGDTADAGETIAAKNVLLRKRDVGGSGWGVTPVTHPMNVPLGTAANSTDPVNPGGTATGYKVDIMAVTVGAGAGFNCDTTANPPTAAQTGGLTNYSLYKCGATNEQKVPDAGFSDIEPSKFFGINTPSGLPAYTTSSGVTTATFGALVFGVPVSTDLRNALQAAQGKAIGSETEANMPSLTTTEIRSLFTGGVANWNNFMVTNPSDVNGPKIPLASLGTIPAGTVPTDRRVQICRRVPGSGTQAQFQVIFLNWPCDQTVSLPSSDPGLPLGPVVANNSGSPDVTNCIDDFNDGSNVSGKNSGLVKRWAIGINSTENNANNAASMRFIKVNGAAPTIQNVHAGNYEDYAEQSFQYRTNTTTLLNASLAVDKADTQNIFAYMAAQGNTPNDTADINTNYVFSWGQGGWLVTPRSSGGFTPTNPFNINNPVNSSTRAPFGHSPNTCQQPVTIKTVTVD